MQAFSTPSPVPRPVRTWATDLDADTRRQLDNVAQLPIIHRHVAAMADAHLGLGATVGSVLATRGAIIPAAVGVDIGCGMIALRLSLRGAELDERQLKRVFDQIGRDVPVGMAQHEPATARTGAARELTRGLQQITDKHPAVLRRMGRRSRWQQQIGTLGGGNHFIEVCLDESDRVWLMLHSGSRGVGNAIGTHFIELAREDMLRQQADLPDRDLAYLREGSAHFDDYVEAVGWAQGYARRNREEMMALVLEACRRQFPPFTITDEVVNCHHNYVAREHHFGADVWVTRKGAIRAGRGELGIVPGSMGAKSYIVRGLGNADSFESSAHGAGRRMSRTEARRRFTLEDMRAQTRGVISRKDQGVIDEIPGAYKDIDEVMANQADLTEVVHTLRQIVNVKG
ncbi:MAG: RtcB family protein [Xanthomonadales bacterium]|nr:RtcB family protein [Xanthomonadales bacterium]